MTSSQKVAALWPLLTFALWFGCLLQVRCDPVTSPLPIDAGTPVAPDMSEQLPDLAPSTPACVPCSWTETINDCVPSVCERRDGMLCCNMRKLRLLQAMSQGRASDGISF